MRRYRILEGWILTAFYPLAAVLVVMPLSAGFLPDLREDWPFALGGPAGAAVWWLTFTANETGVGLAGGYILGAVACAVIVIALEATFSARR